MPLVEKIRRRLSPLSKVMSGTEFRRIRRAPTFLEGTGHVLGRPVRYADSAGFLYSLWELFNTDVYHFEAATAAPHIIDAGANIGLSVIYFKQLYPDATIVAYEPDPRLFALLEQNVQGYAGVDLRRSAAWTQDGEITFFSEGSLAGSVDMDFVGKAQSTTVAAERLKTEIAKRPVDFLKIDIEGAENSVLFDIEPVLDNVDTLFFEYHSDPDKPQLLGDLLNLVTRAGFRYVINGAHGPERPFVETVPHGFDLQLNVSCIRPRRIAAMREAARAA